MAVNILSGKLGVPELIESEGVQQDFGNIRVLPLEQIYPSPFNKYGVKDDDEMAQLAASIKANGLLENLVVRQREEGGYELISGHRRLFAMRKAGLTEARAEVNNIDDAHVKLQMGQYNKYRTITPMERARDYQQQMDAYRELIESGEKTGRADFAIAEMNGVNHSTIQNYIRLNYLIEPMGELVDEGKLKITPAIQISFLPEGLQADVLDRMEMYDMTPSLHQAKLMKDLSDKNQLEQDTIEAIISGTYKETKEKQPEQPAQPTAAPALSASSPQPYSDPEQHERQKEPPFAADTPSPQETVEKTDTPTPAPIPILDLLKDSSDTPPKEEAIPQEPEPTVEVREPTAAASQPDTPPEQETADTMKDPVCEEAKHTAGPDTEPREPGSAAPQPETAPEPETAATSKEPVSQDQPPAPPQPQTTPGSPSPEAQFLQIPVNEVRRYFKPGTTQEQMRERMIELAKLDFMRQRNQQAR